MDGELPQGANVTEDAVTTAPGAGGSDEVFHELLTAADRSEMMWWAVGCGLLTFCVFLLATVIYVRKVMTSPEAIKKKKKSERKRKTAQEDRRTAETAAAGAVPQHHFIRLLRKKRMRGELGMEFRALGRKVEEGSTLVASSPENAAKNAHPDALPYDHCLVRLTSPPADTAYINASYIDGYDTKNVYIAAQGPCRGAIDDFWQLVWQQKVTVIVMATNVFEHARQQCEKYWHNEHGRYGGVDVWLDQQDILAEFTVRTFRLSVEGCDEERVVKHFQFASWSDHDCPNPSSVMECRRRVRVWLKQHPGPMLVHCGAGAGRTGTFIAIDDAIEQASTRRAVDVFNYVLYLRSCRQHMVRDQSQYEFIYDTVAMYLQCGDTVIGLADLPAAVRELAKRGGPAATGGAGGNSFEQQFKTLQTLVAPLSVGECAGGHRAENRRKSRDIMLQPPERARPYLITHDTNDSTDYINAVYVDGYRQINAFIVTQWPLRSTMNDVWRLVYDYNVPTIVLLNNMAFSRNYPCFWPNEIGAKRSHGPLSIELIEEQEDDSIRTRLFKIKKQSKYDHLQASLVAATEMMTLVSLQAMAGNSGDENYKVVKMFQLKCWPNSHKVPASAHGLLELLTRVEDWQINQCHGRIPTLVISKNGVSRCGCYCAISHAWEKLKVEGEVDIFRAVKNVKTNRPQLVENLVEYIYCYTFIVLLVDIVTRTAPGLLPAPAGRLSPTGDTPVPWGDSHHPPVVHTDTQQGMSQTWQQTVLIRQGTEEQCRDDVEGASTTEGTVQSTKLHRADSVGNVEHTKDKTDGNTGNDSNVLTTKCDGGKNELKTHNVSLTQTQIHKSNKVPFKDDKVRSMIPSISKSVKFTLPGCREIKDYANRAAHVYANEGLEGEEDELGFLPGGGSRLRGSQLVGLNHSPSPSRIMPSILKVHRSLTIQVPGLFVRSRSQKNAGSMPASSSTEPILPTFGVQLYEKPVSCSSRDLSMEKVDSVDIALETEWGVDTDTGSDMFYTASCGPPSTIEDESFHDAMSTVSQSTVYADAVSSISTSVEIATTAGSSTSSVFTIARNGSTFTDGQGINNPVLKPDNDTVEISASVIV